MTESKPPLLRLPLEILNEITKDFDLRTVFLLRKTCWQLRRYVDDNNMFFDSQLSQLCICVRMLSIVELVLPFRTQSCNILYEKCSGGCRVTLGGRRNCLENCDFAEVAGNDIGLMLKNLKAEIGTLIITKDRPAVSHESASGRMVSSLVSHLENKMLLVRKLSSINVDQKHAMKLLPHLNPSSLNTLWLRHPEPLNMAQIVNTEQWKVCRSWLSGVVFNTSLCNFHHLNDATFEIDQVSSNDVFMLKEAKLQDPSFREFKFKYQHLTDPRNLKKLLGQPHPVLEDGYQRWFYRIPNYSDKVLILKRKARDHVFALNVKNLADIPADAFG